MTTHRKIALVGCGNMGAALLRGWLARGVNAREIRVIDSQPRALERAKDLGVETASTTDGAAAGVVVLAVKPQQLDALLPTCRDLVRAGALVVSIAAGKPLAFYERYLGEQASIVRAMPNTPAAIGRGITVLVANGAVGAEHRRVAEELMRAAGEVVWIDDESLMDAVTAVSGSGPAYVFLLIEALTIAAREAGLDAALAEQLATATVAGAGAYAQQAGQGAAELRKQVTSPGGTTQAALDVLLGERGLTPLMIEAVRAAARRGRELA